MFAGLPEHGCGRVLQNGEGRPGRPVHHPQPRQARQAHHGSHHQRGPGQRHQTGQQLEAAGPERHPGPGVQVGGEGGGGPGGDALPLQDRGGEVVAAQVQPHLAAQSRQVESHGRKHTIFRTQTCTYPVVIEAIHNIV